MSDNTMVISTPQETQMNNPVVPSVPDISLDPMDFQKEIAKIAAETGQTITNGNVVPAQEPTQPVQAEVQPPVENISIPATPQPVQVPPKFQTPDGQVDLERVQKSTINAEAALEKYRALETELRQKQNEVNKLKTQTAQSFGQPPVQTYTPPPQQPVNPWQQYQPQPLTPDVINQALAKSQNPGQILYETAQIMAQSAYQQARQEAAQDFQALRDRFETKERLTELQTIADKDPWVFSDTGIQTLNAIRQAKPWLNNAPEPWMEAYKVYKADQVLSPIPSVQTPTPQVGTVKAPPTPVQTAVRTNQTMPNFANMGKEDLNLMLDKMTPQQQQQFWRTALPGAK